jgi:hypothetical protein
MAKKNYDAAGKRLRKNGGPWRGKNAKKELPAEELASYQRFSELVANSFKAGKHPDHICIGPGCLFCLRKIRAAEE